MAFILRELLNKKEQRVMGLAAYLASAGIVREPREIKRALHFREGNELKATGDLLHESWYYYDSDGNEVA